MLRSRESPYPAPFSWVDEGIRREFTKRADHPVMRTPLRDLVGFGLGALSIIPLGVGLDAAYTAHGLSPGIFELALFTAPAVGDMVHSWGLLDDDRVRSKGLRSESEAVYGIEYAFDRMNAYARLPTALVGIAGVGAAAVDAVAGSNLTGLVGLSDLASVGFGASGAMVSVSQYMKSTDPEILRRVPAAKRAWGRLFALRTGPEPVGARPAGLERYL